MQDYLNHLARMYILTDRGTPNENPYYQISFALYPNLAMDLIVPLLARLVSVQSAALIFFFVAQVLIITGAIAIELAVKGRHEISAFAALLCLHSMPFSLGLVNFEFGLGIALWGFAAWIALQYRVRSFRFAAHSLFVFALLFFHLFALGVYGLTVGLYELGRMSKERFSVGTAALDFSLIAAPALVMLAFLYATGGALGGTETEWSLSWKPVWVALFLNGYSVPLAAGSMATLIVVLGYLVLTRSIHLSRLGYWIGLGLLVSYFAMPFKVFDSRMADIRMITAVILIIPAFLSVRHSNRAVIPAGTVVSLLIFLNATYAAHVWLSYRHDYAAMKASFALLSPASFILVGHSREEASASLLQDAPMYHAPTLAVHYAKAFVSSLYTIAGTVPVEVRADLKHLDISAATESYTLPSLATLGALAGGQNVPASPGYLKNWTRDFDYVYLVGPRVENALPGVLEEIVSSRRFSLYSVRRQLINP